MSDLTKAGRAALKRLAKGPLTPSFANRWTFEKLGRDGFAQRSQDHDWRWEITDAGRAALKTGNSNDVR